MSPGRGTENPHRAPGGGCNLDSPKNVKGQEKEKQELPRQNTEEANEKVD